MSRGVGRNPKHKKQPHIRIRRRDAGIKSMPPDKDYRKGYDAIFGNKDYKEKVDEKERLLIVTEKEVLNALPFFPHGVDGEKPTEKELREIIAFTIKTLEQEKLEEYNEQKSE